MTNDLAITAAHNYTAVGHGAIMTASSVRAGLSKLFINDDYLDSEGNPVTMAMIKGIGNTPEVAGRIATAAGLGLELLLESYSKNGELPFPQVHLLLGAPSNKRPGPRFADICLYELVRIVEQQAPCISTRIFHHGSASFMYALKEAQNIVTNTPDALCIIGCIDSLLSASTLDWFEKDGRLKSETYGRHHAFIPGEAVGFLIVENADHAASTNRPILARITGTGTSIEPSPRVASFSVTATGLTKACREALKDTETTDISDIFTDLNGENSRAREWQYTQLRIFNKENKKQKLWCPVENYGDIGAAHGVVMAAIISVGLKHNWLKNKVLMSTSDDHGACAALVLEHGDRDEPWISYA